jgi:methyl-accepting chemotaxis protein
MEETASSTEEINATSLEIESAAETIAEKAQEGAV